MSARAPLPPPPAYGLWGLARPLFFKLDPESIHRLTMRGLSAACPWLGLSLAGNHPARHPSLVREAMGLTFPNPIGLAAGLDKDAEAIEAWQAMGFGFIEVGTVTAHPQPGNPRPRLFRLRDDGALMNRMGFNNEGAEAMGRKLTKLREQDRIRVPLGVNLGKSKVTPNNEAASDYRKSFDAVGELSDYLVVNVSSPNTPGLRDLQTTDEVRRIIGAVMDGNSKLSAPRPVLLKLAPDLADEDAVDSAKAALEEGASGLILTNTTISRDGLVGPIPEGTGGISGRPVYERSTEQLRIVREAIGEGPTLVGVGGITDAETMNGKFGAGADLVQVYTGFIYGGPAMVSALCQALATGPAH
jgi:dihydroorotate dehydrogenase